jgi:tRNA threonylcarbamoyladenosine modification (KEOPS) complex  Pcc1 subunit
MGVLAIAAFMAAIAWYVNHLQYEVKVLSNKNSVLKLQIAENEKTIDVLKKDIAAADSNTSSVMELLKTCRDNSFILQQDEQIIDEIINTPDTDTITVPAIKDEVAKDAYVKGIKFINDQFDLIK